MDFASLVLLCFLLTKKEKKSPIAHKNGRKSPSSFLYTLTLLCVSCCYSSQFECSWWCHQIFSQRLAENCETSKWKCGASKVNRLEILFSFEMRGFLVETFEIPRSFCWKWFKINSHMLNWVEKYVMLSRLSWNIH